MEPSWDQKLKREKNHNVFIANTLQDRLKEAARQEITYKESKHHYTPYTSKIDPTRKYTYSFLTSDTLISSKKNKQKKALRSQSGPHLPILLHWRQMENTTGYPQIPQENSNECIWIKLNKIPRNYNINYQVVTRMFWICKAFSTLDNNPVHPQ